MKKKILVGALNIAVHPHPKGIYKQLLFDAFELNQPIKMGETLRMKMAFVSYDDDQEILTGYILKYDSIEIDDNWLDENTGKIAEDKELKKIVIPPNLKPHLRSFRFMFFPNSHSLVFENKKTKESGKVGYDTLGPSVVQMFFDRLFSAPYILKKYSKVAVTILQSKESLEKILNIYDLRELNIIIKKPNHFGVDLSEHLERFLEEQNAGEFQEILKKEKGAPSLTPNEETKKTAEVALSNGKVVGKGFTKEGIVADASSSNAPLIFTVEYDKKGSVPYDELLRKKSADELVKYFKSNSNATNKKDV